MTEELIQAEAPAEPTTETPAAESSKAEADSITADMQKTYERLQSDDGRADKVEGSQKTDTPVSKAPASWNARMAGHWSTLSKEVQDYIGQRETEAQTNMTRLGSEAKSARELSAVLDQFKDYSARLPNHIRQLSTAEQIAQLYRAAEFL